MNSTRQAFGVGLKELVELPATEPHCDCVRHALRHAYRLGWGGYGVHMLRGAFRCLCYIVCEVDICRRVIRSFSLVFTCSVVCPWVMEVPQRIFEVLCLGTVTEPRW